jgi:hypothetical protein
VKNLFLVCHPERNEGSAFVCKTLKPRATYILNESHKEPLMRRTMSHPFCRLLIVTLLLCCPFALFTSTTCAAEAAPKKKAKKAARTDDDRGLAVVYKNLDSRKRVALVIVPPQSELDFQAA